MILDRVKRWDQKVALPARVLLPPPRRLWGGGTVSLHWASWEGGDRDRDEAGTRVHSPGGRTEVGSVGSGAVPSGLMVQRGSDLPAGRGWCSDLDASSHPGACFLEMPHLGLGQVASPSCYY